MGEDLAPRAIDVEGFKAALGSFTTGVTVTTTASALGLHGVTANAVMSVSLEPPLVVVGIQTGTRMHLALRQSDNFALSMLGASQQHVAEYFADSSRLHDAAAFSLFPFTSGSTGAPLLDGALAWVDCRIMAVHAAGDHDLFIGQAVLVRSFDLERPLLYYRGTFG